LEISKYNNNNKTIRLKTAVQHFYRIAIIFVLLEIYYENPDQGSDANPSYKTYHCRSDISKTTS